MEPTRELCTLFDRSYLARGLVLYRSLVEHSPRFRLRVFCMDRETEAVLNRMELPHLVTTSLEELEEAYPEVRRAKPTRSRIEYFWTLTPFTCLYVLEQASDVELVVRLDADLCFYADPDLALVELGGDSVLLTPHRIASEFADTPDEPERWGGTFNVQFEAFRRDRNGLDALRWWGERCVEWCYDRFEPGRYGDQKYLEAVPQRFTAVRALSHPGAGLAPWNVSAHRVEGADGRVAVDGQQLLFHHFQSLEEHPATGAAVRVARATRAYRVTDGPVPLVWTTGWRLSEPELDLLWEPYVRRLSAALGELRDLGEGTLEPPRLHFSRVPYQVARRRLPVALRDAYWRTREAAWSRKRGAVQDADRIASHSHTAEATASSSDSVNSG